MTAASSQPAGSHPTGSPPGAAARDRRRAWGAAIRMRAAALPEWVVVVGIGVLASILRFANLANPHALVFDEHYYVKDAWGLWLTGWEHDWPEHANDGFRDGTPPAPLDTPAFVVHPPLGRWVIALGEALWGIDNPIGWRFSTVVAGVVSVLLLYLVARLLTGSRTVAALTGLFMAIDGNAIVMSRVALLDGLVVFFALFGLVAVLLDRRHPPGERPTLLRPWLVSAGVFFGAAASVKWSGFGLLAAFGLYLVVSETLARRRAGQRHWLRTSAAQAPLSFLLMVPPALLVYVASWSGWFLSSGGRFRHWATEPGNAWGGDGWAGDGWAGIFAWVPKSIQSWIHYQQEILDFHDQLATPHPWMQPSWAWPIQLKPTLMWADYSDTEGCLTGCATVITGANNPLIWWGGWAAAGYLIVVLIRRRSLVPAFVLAGLAGAWLPWLAFPERIGFQFYTIVALPFVVLALAIAIARIGGWTGWLGPERAWVVRARERRRDQALAAAAAQLDAHRVDAHPVDAHGVDAHRTGLVISQSESSVGTAVRWWKPPGRFRTSRLGPPRVFRHGARTAAILVAAICVTSAFWLPLWTAITVPRWFVYLHTWLPYWF